MRPPSPPPAPADPALTLEVLPAGYGDCLLLSCASGRGARARTFRVLVDTGPDECWPSLKARLAQLPVEGGRRRIDLFVVTHVDHDHIGGARLLLEDRELGLDFGDVWFNAPSMPGDPRTRGVAEGQSLARLLGAAAGPGAPALPWNRAFGGHHAVVPPDTGWLELPPLAAGGPRLTLLSPDPARLDDLFRDWERELQRLQRRERNEPVEEAVSVSRGGGLPDLAALAARPTPVDRAAPNGSSIALLLEHGGASVLLGADAFPQVLSAALRALAAHRGAPLPFAVDAFKLSHHGSRANTTLDLMEAVRASHYLVSTNGAIFGHPSDEALARVVVHGGPQPTLCFNHGASGFGESTSARMARWMDAPSAQAHGYRVAVPQGDGQGIVLRLGGRRGAGRR